MFLFLGEFSSFTLIYEENLGGGNLVLAFFGGLGRDPRRGTEEGGQLVFSK
jgi:hypothetical protein